MIVRELRCSSLARYMSCAGFLSFTDLPEDETSPQAMEGTAAGELLQAMLEQKTTKPNVKSHAMNTVRFDEDMWFYLTPIAERVLSAAVHGVLCEQRIDWQATQFTTIRGQYDISYVLGTTLYIEDLKYGWKLVEVKNNYQLIGYAIGEVLRLHREYGFTPSHISFTIHQPRPHHEDGATRTHVITYDELMVHYGAIVAQMTRIDQGDRTLATGNHCRYCPAAGGACPAINRALYNGVDVVMSDFNQDNLTAHQIGQQLDFLKRVEEILKIKKDSLEQLSVTRMNAGEVVTGYTIEKQYGHRKWKPGITAETIEALTGINIMRTEMLSPAQAEKIKVSKAWTDQLTSKPFIGVKPVKGDAAVEIAKVFGNEPIKLIGD